MNGNIVNLVRPDASQDVVNLLSEFLELAKAGTLRSIAIIGEVPDGVHYACNASDIMQTLGALEVLKQEILKSADGEG